MYDGSPPEPAPPPPAAPTVESLTAALKRSKLYADLFRQQRDQTAALANDLQVDLTVARERIKELETELAGLRKPPDDPPAQPASPPPSGDSAKARAEATVGQPG